MRPPLHALLALLLGACCALMVACGEEREGLISSTRAEEIKENLDRIDQDVQSESCEALTGHLAALRRDINDLPGTVDRELRQRLREGLEHLEDRAPDDCRPETTPETTPETVPETIPETVPETVPETTPTVPQETTPQETTPPPTTPPETTPAPPTTPQEEPPPDSGGEQAPAGAIVEEGP